MISYSRRGLCDSAAGIVFAVSLAVAGCGNATDSGVSDGGSIDVGSTGDVGDASDAPVAMIVISPMANDFGMVVQGATKGPVSFTVTNTGGSSSGGMTPSLVGPNAEEFGIVKNNCLAPLGEGESCTVTASFSPATPGAKVAGLQVASVFGGTATGGLVGAGVSASALTLTPNVQPFGTVAVGSTSPKVSFTVTNTGGVPSGVPAVGVGGSNSSDFSIQSNACTTALPAAGTCIVVVRFNPSAAGGKSAILSAKATPGGTAMAVLTGDAADGSTGLSMSPSLNDFGPILVGAQSPTVKFTVTNSGTLATGALTTSLGGVQPGQFQITTNTCMAALMPAATCAIEVKFAPAAPGAKSAVLSVSGTPGGTVSAALSGQGSANAALAISPTLADLGSVIVGSSSDAFQFRVVNGGGVPSGALMTALAGPDSAAFSLVADGCTGRQLLPGGDCLLSVRFTPSAAGARSAILTVAGLPGGTTAAAVTARGLTPGALTISPGGRQFGGVLLGSTADAAVFTITNTGSAPTGTLLVQVSGLHPAQFPIVAGSNNCFNKILAPAASCTVSVAFTPAGAGDKSASLNVSGSPGGTVSASLAGTGLSPAALSIAPQTQDFGSVVQGGSSSNVNFVVTNNGAQTSGGITASILGQDIGDFDVVINGCTTLVTGAKCTVVVRFKPTALGDRTARLEVGAIPGGMALATLNGKGVKPAALTISPTPFTFDDRVVGQTSEAALFTVKNTGGDSTSTLSVALSGANVAEFTIAANGCGALAPGASCDVSVKFAPTSAGGKVASLDVNDGTNSSVSASLGGRGLGKLSIAPATWDFGEISVLNLQGGLLVKPFVVTCTGGGSACGPLQTAVATADPSAFSIVGLDTCAGASLAAGGSCTVVVRFLPTSTGLKTGTLAVTGGGGESASAALIGTAVGCKVNDECSVAGVCEVAVCDVEKGVCGTKLATVGTVCRVAAGICDVAEVCTGDSAECPADRFRNPRIVAADTNADQQPCRPAAGGCDLAEFCSGESAECPADVVQTAEVICHESRGACDPAERCSGQSAVCPDDAVLTTGTVCREAPGACDLAEVCDGQSPVCPDDVFKSVETVCRGSEGICDAQETCTGKSALCPDNLFQSVGTVCRGSAGICDVAEVCTGQSAACPNDAFVSADTVCRGAEGICDVAEACTGQSALCPGDSFKSAETVCRGAEGICDVAESCTGQSGACPGDSFKSAETVCRGAEGICDVAEACTGQSAACPGDSFKSAETVCRGSEGICDVAESCTGQASACPADSFKNSDTVCRGSEGVCDVAENCTGQAAACPSDGFQAASVVCRGSEGVCDVAENCTGQAAACPTDSFKNPDTVCRGSEGVCDVAENSTGQAAACPTDSFKSAETVCRGSEGFCDLAESCTGQTAACPADAFKAATVECRASAGICDVAESCTGQAAACPADVFKAATVECRASDGACDTAESCTGQAAACPADAFKAATVECRASAGVCDTAETCTGQTAACPGDAFKAATTECRPSAGVCDNAENCNGQQAACPGDYFKSSDTECRASAGVCDNAETCTGNAAACPADSFKPDTTECRPTAGACDRAEKCTGSAAACPTDQFLLADVVCRGVAEGDPGLCDSEEKCTGTAAACPVDGFKPGNVVCRVVAGDCDVAETCSGMAAACPSNAFQSNNTICRAINGPCDAAENCSGTSATCPTDAFASTDTICRAVTGMCDVAENCLGTASSCPADGFKPDGTGCNDSDVCTGNDVCTAGVCAGPQNHCGNGTCNCNETAVTCRQDCPGPGDLDKTFATSGVVRGNFQDTDDAATAIVIVPSDQKIFVSGFTHSATAEDDNLLLARYSTTGALDTWVQTDVTHTKDRSYAMALDVPNARIMLAGTDNGGLVAARYTYAGALDTGFNGTGIRADGVTGGGGAYRGVVVQPDGMVVLSGEGVFDNDGLYKLLMNRMSATAVLDTMGFNAGSGYRILNHGQVDNFGGSLVRLGDGSLVVGGGNSVGFDDDMLLCRLTSAGVPEASWGADGFIQTDWTMGTGIGVKDNANDSAEMIEEMTLDPVDSSIIAVGSYYPQVVGTDFDTNFAIIKYKSNGALDSAFGTNGKVSVDFDGEADRAFGVARDADGKLVVVGESKKAGKVRTAIVRLNSNGTLDSTFGTGGKSLIQVDASGFAERGEGVAIQADGNVVVTGWSDTGAARHLFVLRLVGPVAN